jgi:hypothetical protein
LSEENVIEEVIPPTEGDETEQVEQVEKEAEEATTTEESADDSGEPSRKDKGVGKRINELTREKYEAKREADYWKQQAERAAFERQQAPAPKVEVTGEPKPDQFESFEEYNRALVRFEAKVLLEQERQSNQAAQAQYQQQQQQSAWKEREAAAREKLVDYDATVYPMLDIPAVANNPYFAAALVDSPIGAEVLYHLGKNPTEAIRIASLNPAACAREIGKLEAKLESQSKKTSSAPPPPKPVHGGAKATSGLRDDIPVDEWLKRRNAEIKNR